jgi:hypothetical protein
MSEEMTTALAPAAPAAAPAPPPREFADVPEVPELPEGAIAPGGQMARAAQAFGDP